MEMSQMNLQRISFLDDQYKDLRRYIYEFLYSNYNFIDDISVYKTDDIGYVIKNESEVLHLIHES